MPVLSWLLPAQKGMLDAALTSSLAKMPDGAAKEDGVAVGKQVAAKYIAMRGEDGSAHERERPGELLHLDTKKLGRIGGLGHRITGRRTGVINRHLGIGWEYLHVCVDDASRLAYTEILADGTQGERRRLPRPCPRLVRLLWRQRRARHDRQRQLLPQPPLPPSLQRRRYPTPAHNPIRHVPMARPSASFKPSCENAPTPAPSTRHRNEQTRCRGGRTPTTSIGRTPHSPASPQSPGSTRTTFLLTTSRPAAFAPRSQAGHMTASDRPRCQKKILAKPGLSTHGPPWPGETALVLVTGGLASRAAQALATAAGGMRCKGRRSCRCRSRQ